MRTKPLEFVKEVGDNNDPLPVEWMANQPDLMVPMEGTMRNAQARAASLTTSRPKMIGRLFREWHGHNADCMVIANNDNPGTGEEFAVSKQRMYMRFVPDADAQVMLDANPTFRGSLMSGLAEENCSEVCFIKVVSGELELKWQDAKGSVSIKPILFNQSDIISLVLAKLRHDRLGGPKLLWHGLPTVPLFRP